MDLVAVPAADQVPQAIAQALGVRQTGDLPLLDAMIAAMGDRRLFLVLDNFEHVLAAAPLCAALLGACPSAKALVTSRAALNIRGEHEFAVPPLRVPDLESCRRSPIWSNSGRWPSSSSGHAPPGPTSR